jgi:hypothetical protein
LLKKQRFDFQLDTYSGDKAKSEDEGQSVAFWGTVSEVFGNNVDDSQLPSEDNDRVLLQMIFSSQF